MTAYGMRISDWSSDVCSSDLVVAFATWAAITTIPAIATITSVAAITTAFAVAVALAHHDRRSGFMRIDAQRHIADHVFVDRRLAFQFGDGGGGGVNVHQDIMRIAVLADAEIGRASSRERVLQ